jgi:tetratricopeptide (TPR) repeat protein
VPAQVRDVIGRRLDQLDLEVRRVLQTAAVMGQEFSAVQLSRTMEIGQIELEETLVAALDAQVCERVATESNQFVFSHPMIRQVLYGELTPAERAARHRRVAEAIESFQRNDDHLVELAYHYERAVGAGCADRAVAASVAAGHHMLAMAAYDEGARLFDVALRIHEDQFPQDRLRRCEILALASYWRRIGGRHDDAKVAIHALINEARALRSPEFFGRGVLRLAVHNYSSMGVDEELVTLLEEAIALVGTTNLPLRAELLARLASRLEAAPGDSQRRSDARREALALLPSIDDPPVVTEVLSACHDATSGPDDLEERLEMSAELIRWGHRLPEKVPVAAGHLRRFAALLEAGRRLDSDRELEQLAQIAEGRRMPSHTRAVKTCRAALATLSGDFAEAERFSQESLAAGQGYDPDAVAVFGAQLFSIRWQQGRAGELTSLLQGALNPSPSFLPWRAALAVMHTELGQRSAARGEFEAFANSDFTIMPRNRYWTVTMVMLAEVCAYLEDADRAAVLYELLLPFRARTGVGGLVQVCTGSNERPLGMLAATTARWTEAEAHFDAALRANRAMRATPWVARTLSAYARMLESRNAGSDSETARRLSTEASEIAADLGMRTLDE